MYMKKNKFLLPVVAAVLMLGAFIFLYLDLGRSDNTYVKDTKMSQEAKQEAEAAILFGDVKKELAITHIVTTKKDFQWYVDSSIPTPINGWSIYSKVDPTLLEKLDVYLKSKDLEPNVQNTISNTNTFSYERGLLVCQVVKARDNTTVEFNCGYLK